MATIPANLNRCNRVPRSDNGTRLTTLVLPLSAFDPFFVSNAFAKADGVRIRVEFGPKHTVSTSYSNSPLSEDTYMAVGDTLADRARPSWVLSREDGVVRMRPKYVRYSFYQKRGRNASTVASKKPSASPRASMLNMLYLSKRCAHYRSVARPKEQRERNHRCPKCRYIRHN